MITMTESPDEALRAEVEAWLIERAAAVGHRIAPGDLSFSVQEGERLQGGLIARVALDWMKVELLAIAPEARGQGWGRKLMGAAEAEARRRGLTGIWLDTFTFQAPDFYRALGFEEVGRIEDYPEGEARVFFRKRLA